MDYLPNCGIVLVAVNPGILVIFGSAFVILFFFYDVSHILPRLTARLQRDGENYRENSDFGPHERRGWRRGAYKRGGLNREEGGGVISTL